MEDWERSFFDNGEGLIFCKVLRQNGELRLRELRLARDKFSEGRYIV